MSVRIYNEETGLWEKQATLLAEGIQMVDVEGKFKSPHVKGCLVELSDSVKKVTDDVKYIYENGTIGGGGGGGGGSSVPTVTLDGELQRIVDSSEVIDIFYYFQSPNVGNGQVHLSKGDDMTVKEISQSRHKWTVGPFPRGTHRLSISVQDKQGFWSIPAQIEVVSGALELQSNFNDSRDFTLNDDIEIGYNVITDIAEEVFLEYTLNGATTTVPVGIGPNTLNLGKLPFMGVSTFTMKVYNSKFESNPLRYMLVAADSKNLFISTGFNDKTVELGKGLQLDYRVSMRGQYAFTTKYFIDGELFDTVTSKPGVNFWNVSRNLPLGVHTLRIETTTLDGVNTAELSVTFEVVNIGYTPYTHVRSGLIAEFDATGQINTSLNKTVWTDTSGNGVSCDLHNFNYTSNGWIDDALVFSGKAYAEIGLKPFKEGIKNGLTIDFAFKTECVGNVEAKVLSCKNPLTPFQGIEIDTTKASIITSDTEVASVHIQEDKWTTMTYVVDRATNMMIIYQDGVISSASHLKPNDLGQIDYKDEFTYDGNLILGGGLGPLGDIINHSVTSIKNIRVYNKALTDDEVLRNFIAGITDEAEQLRVRELNSTNEGMPTLEFKGNFDLMDENAIRSATIIYNDPSNPSKTFVKDSCPISWQGTSSKNYPVKNYSMQLMSGGEPDLKYVPKDDWKPERVWTLKANYMDSSGANNPGTNKFIHDFFKPYPNPAQVADPTTRANVDGFPIRMIINGEEIGVYSWMIDRNSPNNYGFVEYREDGTTKRHESAVSYEVAVNSTSGASAFHDDSWESIRTEFRHRYNRRDTGDTPVTEVVPIEGTNATVLKAGMHTELVDLIRWVKNASDEEFRGELDNHFSMRHLIDYYILAYSLGMVDNLGKNMVLSTWGKNQEGDTIWYPSFYDCDSLFGLNNSGIIAFDAGLDMAEGDYNTSGSRLWVMLNKHFGQEIRNRYAELRLPRTIDGKIAPPILSKENIMKYLDGEIMSQIGQKYYNYDARHKYFDKKDAQWLYLCNGMRKDFTERWLKERFIYMDSVYEFNYNVKSVIRSYAQGRLTLKIKTYSPQWILVSFSDAANTKVKRYVGKDYYTTFTADVSNGTDNNIEIYGVDNIMFLDGIKDLDVRSVNIANAEKLVEIDISESSRIEELELGNNTYLQKVLVNDCPKLGYQVDNRTLNLANCSNLREVDCSNTYIANVVFNEVGGVIDYLNCSNTDITSFRLRGQEYLTGLMLDNCDNLSELQLVDCNGLQSVNVADTKLSTVLINGCNQLELIDISHTKSLKNLDLSGCPNLKTLLMAGVSNPAIRDLDLTNSLKLETLDISASIYIDTLTFGQYTEDGVLKNYSALKNLECPNSAIKSIRYGKATPAPAYLDLAGLDLKQVSFNSCTNVTDIRNINLEVTNGAPFNNCYNLVSIQGNVKLIGSTSRAFYNCTKLRTLPTLDLSEITSFSETFMYSTSLTMAHLRQIMLESKVSPKLTSTYRAFYGCTGISGVLPSNLFSQATGIVSLGQFFLGTNVNGAVPVGLLAPLTNLTSADRVFQNTNVSGAVPAELLKNNVNLVDVQLMFSNTKVTSVTLNHIFKYNTKLQNVSSMFQGCTELQETLHEEMFINNKELTTANNLFNGCSKIVGQIPRNIFNNTAGGSGTSKLQYIDGFFANTSINGEIPSYVSPQAKGLLDNLTGLVSASNLFANCIGVYGEIPKDLFKYNNLLARLNGAFQNNSSLWGAIPQGLLSGKTRLTTVSNLFSGCTGLVSTIPVGMLDDSPSITDISGLFRGCVGLTGQIPKRISTWNGDVETVTQYGLFDKCSALVNASSVFSGCVNLASEIPETLLINASRVTSIDDMFYKCYRIYGPVPKDLLKNCRNLVSMRRTFFDCVGLGEYLVDEERPYALPETLFENCLNLVDVTSAFHMNGTPPHGSRLKGSIPPRLFANNLRLRIMNSFMYACSQVNGELDGNLFVITQQLESVSYAFAGTSITALGNRLFGNSTKIKDMSYVFLGCSSLRGNTPEFWSDAHAVKANTFTGAFRGATGLSNYGSIPDLWK